MYEPNFEEREDLRALDTNSSSVNLDTSKHTNYYNSSQDFLQAYSNPETI